MTAPRAERRLAAILAADIVGYSRLVDQDEAGTLAAVKRLRETAIDPIVSEHLGRIVKLMGDGMIVEFGSVVGAVACAIAVQKAVAERQIGVPTERHIVYRIGINLGDVVVDGDDLLGDGVIVATRLEQLCEPGGVLVSGTAYDQLQGKLGLPLEFTGEQRVKNIARPVRAYRVRLDGKPVRSAWPLRNLRLGAAAATLIIVATTALWQFWPQEIPPFKAFIAVLPLENRSGDARLGRLADSMIENVIGDLSVLGWDVMARGTTFAYRDVPHDPRRIGSELGVRYVVEGSIEGDDKRLLANVALVEATTGRQVWRQRYDRPLDDLFAVQDDLAQQIAIALGGAAERARLDATRKKSPRSLNALDFQQLGNEQLGLETAEGNARAIDLLRRAVELQPESSYTRTSLASAYRQQVDENLAPRAEAMASWLDVATTAVRLDPQNGCADYMLGQRYLYDNDLARWSAELQRASELGQRNVALMAEMGAIDLPQAGQTGRGVELVERAVRLDPLNIENYRWAQRNAYFFARRYAEAAAAAEAIGKPTRWGKLYNTLIYAQLGRDAEVERWRSSLLADDPDVSAEHVLWWGGDFLLPQAAAERALLIESIEKAGLPRCATAEQLAREPAMRRTVECDAERASAAASRT